LTVAGNSILRLYGFPVAVVAALRRLFEQRNLLSGFREKIDEACCEFSLDGKPWNSAKSIGTEKLLVDTLILIYQFGFTFLANVDYGRETDDRIAMTFSKTLQPVKPLSDSPSPSSQPELPNLQSSPSVLPQNRIPFAISFQSETDLRVINPPLHSTPAILQAVRNSWPRGVVSERVIGDGIYEFTFKGYKCKRCSLISSPPSTF
jgi:hypothetical protein